VTRKDVGWDLEVVGPLQYVGLRIISQYQNNFGFGTALEMLHDLLGI
jgi:hypothetical protein